MHTPKLLLLSTLLAAALPAAARDAATPAVSNSASEQQVAAIMQRDAASPTALHTFLVRMPKGGDLHNHLVGAIYAEDFLRWADEDGDCVDTTTHMVTPAPCGAGQVSARGLAARNSTLYSKTIDAMSMRNYSPTPAEPSGHDQFFDAFALFGTVAKAHRVDTIVATLEQAARDNLAYVEIMVDPAETFEAGKLLDAKSWKDGDYAGSLRKLQPKLPAMVASANKTFNQIDQDVHKAMRCGHRDASPGCGVEYRYLTYVMRTFTRPSVFGQMTFNYALAHDHGSRFVGVNIVAPEDNPVALSDYRVHMDMFRYLSKQYPDVKLTLHAGELTQGLVPPADLRFHIHDAVDAGASRIGHGVDIAYEDGSHALLKRMRDRHVAVEINLSSNDVILGVKGKNHPLSMYLHAGVPVVLSTDDQGVSRSDMTHEYERAVQEQGLDYPTLKQIARNGVSFSFLPGTSLWGADGRTAAPACAGALNGSLKPDRACRELIDHSAKARVQWHLEQQFARFEHDTLAMEHAE